MPRNDAKYHWTNHVGQKMLYYGLSPDRVKRVIRSPYRSEKGIAPDTIAVMQSAGTPKKPTEVWVMYAMKKMQKSNIKNQNLGIGSKKVIITAWRYPGVSKVRDEIPIPADILEELKTIKF